MYYILSFLVLPWTGFLGKVTIIMYFNTVLYVASSSSKHLSMALKIWGTFFNTLTFEFLPFISITLLFKIILSYINGSKVYHFNFSQENA